MIYATSRRTVLCGAGAVAGAAFSTAALAALHRPVLARVIVDNDFAGDPDGLVALAHQLASRSSRCVLITTSTLDPGLASAGGLAPRFTAAQGAEFARELMAQMEGAAVACPVVAGSEQTGSAGVSAAARAIVAEAMRDDPLPLLFACGGPLTNLAQALRLEPRIAARMALVWLGGDSYPQGGAEYNLSTDIEAARFVIEQTGIPLWQVPMPTYSQCLMSIEDIERNIRPLSPTTEWLCARYDKLPPFVKLGGTISFGDSALVLLTSISAASSHAHDRNARRILADARYGDEIPGRTIRVYDTLDVRLLFSDFVAAMHPGKA